MQLFNYEVKSVINWEGDFSLPFRSQIKVSARLFTSDGLDRTLSCLFSASGSGC